jgi:thymidylate synthase
MLAQQCDLDVGDFVHTFGDTHLYQDHLNDPNIVAEQLTRVPKDLPKLVIKRKPDSIFDYVFEDFEITGYEPGAAIKAPISV